MLARQKNSVTHVVAVVIGPMRVEQQHATWRTRHMLMQLSEGVREGFLEEATILLVPGSGAGLSKCKEDHKHFLS